MTKHNGAPALGALAAFWIGSMSTVMIACTIDAHWAPAVEICLDPRYDEIIFQDPPNPSLILNQTKSTTEATTLQGITISTN